ncbi:hypothetical protein NDU88_003091 [Pleurodeles waltl]|uniref:Uncharacterized protein n=1 Tax=Pleurodeles waltl TaxID=8319 RepID=A0AAV7NFM0_PLEWA|nr:hypothetical protein NDU88_003091 [Pleurodeles waltl]
MSWAAPTPTECINFPAGGHLNIAFRTAPQLLSLKSIFPPTIFNSPPDNLDIILQEIWDSRSAIEYHIDLLSADLGLLRDDHCKLSDKVKTSETTLSALTSQEELQSATINELLKQLTTLQDRAEDVEGPACRNNVRIVGLPEGMKGPNPILYIEQWLQTSTAPQGISTLFTVERACRVLTRHPSPGAPPHSIVSCIPKYRDQDVPLQKAIEKAPIILGNGTVSLFLDYRLEVQCSWVSFLAAKRQLWAEGLSHALVSPACFRVVCDKHNYFFGTGWNNTIQMMCVILLQWVIRPGSRGVPHSCDDDKDSLGGKP